MFYELCFFLLGLFLFFISGESSEGYVSVQLNGQFGNQLFEIGTAYAYALDQGLELTVPDLLYKKKDNIPHNAELVFLPKISTYFIPVSYKKWKEPSFNYSSIPLAKAIELEGFFQSEKYFKHRRGEILDLFAAPSGLNDLILSKYPILASDALIVGIQIRDYRVAQMYGKNHPTIGRSYYEKAMALFPKETIFFVSSNNLKYAEDCTKGLSNNIIYLQNGSNYIEDFYTLVLCKSFIISNSTFGWWAAWLSQDPDKVVIAPDPWFTSPLDNKTMTKDLLPKEWIIIENKKNKKLQ